MAITISSLMKRKKMERTIFRYTFALYIFQSVISPGTFGQIQFELSVGGTSEDRAYSIIQTSDGGFAAAGYTSGFGAVNWDIYIVKLDAGGSLQWSRTIGGAWREEAFDLIQTSDGGYAVAGYTHTFGQTSDEDMYMVKLDSLGTFQWHKAIGAFDFGERNREHANSIIQSNDGGYILAGYTWRPPNHYYHIYIVKLDSSGSLQWEKILGGPSVDIARSITQTSDGGFAIAGYSRTTGADNFYIAKFDENGNLQWNTAVGGTHDDRAYSIIQTSDGGYAIAGETLSFTFSGANQSMYIVKLDSTGTLQWTRVVGGTQTDRAYDIIQSSDGGYMVTGHTNSHASQSINRVYIVKLNENGELQWSKTVGGTWSESSRSITQTIDGGFTTAGFTLSYGTTPSVPNMYILKFDSNGFTCENSTSFNSLSATGGNVFTPFPEFVFAPTFINEPTPVIGSGGAVTSICTIIPVELTSFISSVNGNNVTLSWVTASEVNNSGFEVQRKGSSLPTGQAGLQSTVSNFETIGFVEGYGTTTETNHYSFEDKNLSSGNYSYRLRQIDFDGTFEYSNEIEVEINIPNEFSLSQNYPNPFNPKTVIGYQLPVSGSVTLKVYDLLGREVAVLVNEEKPAGVYEVEFSAKGGSASGGDAFNLSSGVYFYQLKVGNQFIELKKLVLLK